MKFSRTPIQEKYPNAHNYDYWVSECGYYSIIKYDLGEPIKYRAYFQDGSLQSGASGYHLIISDYGYRLTLEAMIKECEQHEIESFLQQI